MASKCNIVKAILTRVLFIMHAMVVIWRATVVKGRLYWVLTSTLGGLIFELIIVIMVNKGEEWKWFCPSVFFYLASVVPSLWLLELNRLDKLRQGLTSMNVTTTSVKLGQMELSLELSEQEWVLLIEQAMMVLLIVGRWLLPKGELTRAQLSQLLLVYLALAADMIDFFTIFGEKGAIGDKVFVYAILSGWSWSLMQFTIVLTATKSRRMRIVTPEEAPSADLEDDKEPGACGCCETELWSILMTTFMQDGPYFVLRMVALAYYRVFSYSILFFTCKNGMILLLQLYRLIVTSVEMRQKKREAEERRKLKGLGSCETLRKLSLVGDKYIRERSNDSGNSSVVG